MAFDPTSVLVPVISAASGYVVAQVNSRVASARELRARRAADRRGVLDPLARAAESLGWKTKTVMEKLAEPQEGTGGLSWMLQSFHRAKHPDGSPSDYGYWCNGEGFFVMSTIYATALYFSYATQARRQYVGERALVQLIDAVSDAYAQGFGIYHMIQESIGHCLAVRSAPELTYRPFCERFYREDERLWFLRILDYYRTIDKRAPEARVAVCNSLNGLLTYLVQTAQLDARNPFAPKAR